MDGYTKPPNSATLDSLKTVLKSKKNKAKVDILQLISNELQCNDTQAKISYLNEALTLSEELQYEKGIFESLKLLGYYYSLCQQDYQSATDWHTQSLEFAQKNNQSNHQYIAYENLAECYNQQGIYKKAIACYTEILQLEISRDRKIQALGNSGVVYKSIGEYAKALRNYQDAYNLLFQDMVSTKESTYEDTLTLMGIKYEIANIYKAIPDYDRALQNYQDVKKLNEQIQFPYFFVLVDIGIGDCHLDNNVYNKAIVNYKSAVNTISGFDINSTQKTEDQSNATNKIAIAFLKQNKIDSAKHYANQALSIASGQNNKHKSLSILPLIYITLGKVSTAEKNYNHALSYLNKALQMGDKNEAIDLQSTAFQQLSFVHEKMGNTAAALETYQKHIALRDSIYNNQKLQELTRIDMQGYFDRQMFSDSLQRAKETAINQYKFQRQRLLTYTGFGITALLLVFSYLLFRNYRRQKRDNIIISNARDAIREEKKVSEKLLHNILPEEIAEDLKKRGATTAKHFNTVTVMFTDFVNFTKAGERMGSEALVEELHSCFKVFDEIIDKHNIEKIKTIGDAYLAVSGLPTPDNKHASNIINAAREIQSFMLNHREKLGDKTFEIRIGLHSGDVTAGIVGVKKFAYDIWGDTVNTAARMEQSSQPGKINISETTYELVKHEFNCVYRGEIEAKNKGKMKMYFVE